MGRVGQDGGVVAWVIDRLAGRSLAVDDLHLTHPATLSVGAELATLTTREAQVLKLVAGGRTTAQIATRLGIADSTVESHVRSIRIKLGVPTRTAAAAWAAGWRAQLTPAATSAPGPSATEALGRPLRLESDADGLLEGLARGWPVGAAARAANMSLRTAHRRLRQARASLGVATTAEAVGRWAQYGRAPVSGRAP
jgi:DNA-binding NarL/FixJ family response regulator